MIINDTILDKSLKFSNCIAWQIEQTENFVYVLNNETKKWYFFNDISKDIWLQIQENRSINDIVKVLMSEYEVDFQTLLNDIKDYILSLLKEGLVTYEE